MQSDWWPRHSPVIIQIPHIYLRNCPTDGPVSGRACPLHHSDQDPIHIGTRSSWNPSTQGLICSLSSEPELQMFYAVNLSSLGEGNGFPEIRSATALERSGRRNGGNIDSWGCSGSHADSVQKRVIMINPTLHLPNLALINPLSPHDALKHHLRSLKTYFILLKLRGFRRKYLWNFY